MKVICAGIPKTGTKTMAEALRILGYDVHDIFHQFFYDRELWYKVRDNAATREDYRKALRDVDAVTDYPGCVMWEQILEAFPDAKVILMVRSSEDEWYASVKYLFARLTNLRYNVLMYPVLNLVLGPLHREFLDYSASFLPFCLGYTRTWGRHTEVLLRSRYRQHNHYVKATCPKKNLLVYNTKEGWGPICKFLGVDVPDKPFPVKNVKTSIVDEVARGEYEHDCGYYRKVMRQTLVRVLALVVLSIAFLACFYLVLC